MFKNLNLPNKLTLIRILLVPVFIILMVIAGFEDLKWFAYIALAVYVIAAITDFIDGKIARSKNLVTDFGKVMDPLADKILVASGFVMFTYLGIIPGWITAIIICRDFFIDGLRTMALMQNVVVPASLSGKIKTFFQMGTIVLALVNFASSEYYMLGNFIDESFSMNIFTLFVNVFMSVCIIGTVIATVVSLIIYIINFTKILRENETEDEITLEADDSEDEKTEENTVEEEKVEEVKEETLESEEESTSQEENEEEIEDEKENEETVED